MCVFAVGVDACHAGLGEHWSGVRATQSKDERGIPDRRGFPDRTVQPRPDSGHGAIFCLNRGSVRSGVKKTGRVGNGVVFSRCGYDFSVRDKILIEMK